MQLDDHVRVVRLEPEGQAQRVGELPAAGKTIFGSLRQGAQQDVIGGRRKAGPPRGQRWRRYRQVRVQHRHDFMPGKWRLAGQQRVHRARQGVLIRARVDLVTSDLLGRAIMRRPQDVAGSGLADPRQRAFRQPEIGQVHMIGPAGPRIDEHVGRLDVTVHQPGGMRGIQGRGHRGDDRGRAGRRQRPLVLDQGPCITARHVPHRDEQDPIRIAGFVHGDDVRIIHGRRRPGFADEAVPECLVRGQRGREDLQRYLPLKPLVLGAEYHRHPALADLLLQAVAGDARTGREAGEKPKGSGPLIAHRPSRTREPPIPCRRARFRWPRDQSAPGHRGLRYAELTKMDNQSWSRTIPSRSPTRGPARQLVTGAGPQASMTAATAGRRRRYG